jgi:hypothetical protein
MTKNIFFELNIKKTERFQMAKKDFKVQKFTSQDIGHQIVPDNYSLKNLKALGEDYVRIQEYPSENGTITLAEFREKYGNMKRLAFNADEVLLETANISAETPNNKILLIITRTTEGVERLKELVKLPQFGDAGAQEYKFLSVIKKKLDKFILCSNSGVPVNDVLMGLPGQAVKKIKILI